MVPKLGTLPSSVMNEFGKGARSILVNPNGNGPAFRESFCANELFFCKEILKQPLISF
ncbi:hypothetical protein kam1_748 [Methylacidiphilum kamchatkense Kam1]|uniref:Uncharacterized protein n=1 Tax=Methylacidiphilum kamchatkense Kam1 TaxID=1202785 RepID=A0A516TL73_9BACT|nr:hypothetical protein kam1_748 [Methylacidiphilum kamchatkense Kam1]